MHYTRQCIKGNSRPGLRSRLRGIMRGYSLGIYWSDPNIAYGLNATVTISIQNSEEAHCVHPGATWNWMRKLQRWDSNPRYTPYEGGLVPSPDDSASLPVFHRRFLRVTFSTWVGLSCPLPPEAHMSSIMRRVCSFNHTHPWWVQRIVTEVAYAGLFDRLALGLSPC